MSAKPKQTLVVAAHPIGGAEQTIQVLQGDGNGSGARLRETAAFGADVGGKLLHVAVEFREALERRLQRPRISLPAAAIGSYEAANLHSAGSGVRDARAADLIVEIDILRREQHVVRRGQQVIGWHDALTAKLNSACGAGSKFGVDAVPDRNHQAAVAGDQRAGTLQLTIAKLAGLFDIARCGIVRHAKFDHLAGIAQPVEGRAVVSGLQVFPA